MPTYDLQARTTTAGPDGRPRDVRWDPVPSGTGLATLDAAMARADVLLPRTAWRVMRRSDDGTAYEQVMLTDPVSSPAVRTPSRVRAAARTRPRGR